MTLPVENATRGKWVMGKPSLCRGVCGVQQGMGAGWAKAGPGGCHCTESGEHSRRTRREGQGQSGGCGSTGSSCTVGRHWRSAERGTLIVEGSAEPPCHLTLYPGTARAVCGFQRESHTTTSAA